MFDVMMMIVFLKSTTRPLPSVSRPSSMICSRMLNTSWMRLLNLIKQNHRIRTPPHRLGQLPALFVADIPRRRANQPRNRMPLHVLRHINANQRVFVIEKEIPPAREPTQFFPRPSAPEK